MLVNVSNESNKKKLFYTIMKYIGIENMCLDS